jgi:hypothetical protein
LHSRRENQTFAQAVQTGLRRLFSLCSRCRSMLLACFPNNNAESLLSSGCPSGRTDFHDFLHCLYVPSEFHFCPHWTARKADNLTAICLENVGPSTSTACYRHSFTGYRSRYSDWLWAGRTRGRSSSAGWIKYFLYSMPSTQPPIQWVPGALSPGVKRPGHEVDHSLLTIIKNSVAVVLKRTTPTERSPLDGEVSANLRG